MSRIGRGCEGEGGDYWVKERGGASRRVEGIMERERASSRGNGRQGEEEGFKEWERASRRGIGRQGEVDGVKERVLRRGRGCRRGGEGVKERERGSIGVIKPFSPFPFLIFTIPSFPQSAPHIKNEM